MDDEPHKRTPPLPPFSFSSKSDTFSKTSLDRKTKILVGILWRSKVEVWFSESSEDNGLQQVQNTCFPRWIEDLKILVHGLEVWEQCAETEQNKDFHISPTAPTQRMELVTEGCRQNLTKYRHAHAFLGNKETNFAKEKKIVKNLRQSCGFKKKNWQCSSHVFLFKRRFCHWVSLVSLLYGFALTVS